MYIIIGFICFILLFYIVCFYYKKCINEDKKIDNFLQEYFPLLENDYTLIETTCFYCLKSKEKENKNLFKLYDNIDLSEEKENMITENDININYNSKTEKKDIINDINNNKFSTLLEYIEPKTCPHFYHEKCKKKNANFAIHSSQAKI